MRKVGYTTSAYLDSVKYDRWGYNLRFAWVLHPTQQSQVEGEILDHPLDFPGKMKPVHGEVLVKTWQEDQIQALLAADDEQKLFPALVALAHDLGFDYCAYGLRLPLPVSNPKP